MINRLKPNNPEKLMPNLIKGSTDIVIAFLCGLFVYDWILAKEGVEFDFLSAVMNHLEKISVIAGYGLFRYFHENNRQAPK